MHEFTFAKKDVLNPLNYLTDHGVIIMHDFNPVSKDAYVTFKECKYLDCTGNWNGDVWKVIPYIRSMHHDLYAFVLDCDLGIGIITKRPEELPLSFHEHEIEAMTYQGLDSNRVKLHNLKPEKYLYEYFKIKP